MTRVGQYIFGIGLGVTASVISVLGYNPELTILCNYYNELSSSND